MKRLLTLAALFTAFSGPAFAADKVDGMEYGAMHAATTATGLTDGLVKKVDKTAGKLTLTHGPLPNGMPGMTMVFRVKDPAWLANLNEGQTIRFAIDEAMTIVRLELAR